RPDHARPHHRTHPPQQPQVVRAVTDELHYDDRTERALLGTVMGAPDQTRTEFQTLPAAAWYTPRARTLARGISPMLSDNPPPHPTTVAVAAQNRGLVTTRLTGDYIIDCFQNATHAVSMPLLVERVLNLSACRQLHDAALRTAQRVESSWTTGVDRLDTIEH